MYREMRNHDYVKKNAAALGVGHKQQQAAEEPRRQGEDYSELVILIPSGHLLQTCPCTRLGICEHDGCSCLRLSPKRPKRPIIPSEV